MKDGKIRIGLIGAGNICQNSHIPALTSSRTTWSWWRSAT